MCKKIRNSVAFLMLGAFIFNITACGSLKESSTDDVLNESLGVSDGETATATNDQDTQTHSASYIVGSGTCGENLLWTLDGEGVLTISGSGTMTNYGAAFGVEKPWKEFKEDIVSVEIGNEVTSIGYAAFSYCHNLKNVSIGSGVFSIGKGAFCECTSLTDIVLPESVSHIYEYAFDTCSALKSVTIKNTGRLTIQSNAFDGCSNIADVYYSGTEEGWNKNMDMYRFNSEISDANIHYNN
ncbi:MAG: leucine-rich repeat domain-containing protein [Clostridia bacterium]|nr:leucine-rich repeat domain-containing protein [Clostridia bacterium]